MSNVVPLVVDIVSLYEKMYGTKPYVVPELQNEHTELNQYRVKDADIYGTADKVYTKNGSLLKEKYRGIEILLPVSIYDESRLVMYVPYCTVTINGGKEIIETQLAERIGTVKEQFNTNDYEIIIKGFLISEDRRFPEAEIEELKNLFETSKALSIDNALLNIFLSKKGLREQGRVVVYNFDLPEVSGGRENVRPFTMMLKSDYVFTLELE